MMAAKRISPWLLLSLLLAAGCDGFERGEGGVSVSARNAHFLGQTTAPVYTYHVVSEYPHDEWAFTQGLVLDGDMLIEGTGRRGQSTLRRVELETGEVVQQVALDGNLFGEGVTLFGDRIFQLTWQSKIGFVYDRATFAVLDTFAYDHEGWGITHDGSRLIVSDGTCTIRFWDPETLQETGRIEVRDGGLACRNVDLNELEYIHGEIWANVWKTDLIYRIDPTTGTVTGMIDLRYLLPLVERTNTTDVLNGIAYDTENDRLFVTGKNWPRLYEIEVNDPPQQRAADDYEPA